MGMTRLETCMKDVKFRVDPDIDADKQAKEAVKKMIGKLSFAKAVALQGTLTLPLKYMGSCSNAIQSILTMTGGEDYVGTNVVYKFESTRAGIDKLIEALSKPTSGDYQLNLQDDGSSAKPAAAEGKGKKGKKGKKKKKGGK